MSLRVLELVQKARMQGGDATFDEHAASLSQVDGSSDHACRKGQA
jgi:hypothetical protein